MTKSNRLFTILNDKTPDWCNCLIEIQYDKKNKQLELDQFVGDELQIGEGNLSIQSLKYIGSLN